MRLEALLSQPRTVPDAPALATQWMETFGQPDHSIDPSGLAQGVIAEPALAQSLITQSNAIGATESHHAATVAEAMRNLGVSRSRALVLGALLRQSLGRQSQPDAGSGAGTGTGTAAVGAVESAVATEAAQKWSQFWRYSFNTARLARFIAKPVGVDLNLAFTVGMVHAVGEVMMHAGMPEAMRTLDANVSPLAIKRAETEFQTFGYTYAEVGAALARHWRFPTDIANAIAFQREPFDADRYAPIAGVIHMAAWRARAAELGQTRIDLIHTYPDEVGEVLELDPDLLMDDLGGMLSTPWSL
jgi:HD-like signal output (HDOD) protein